MQPESPDTLRMRQALALARRAVGRASPNPAVGALLVREGEVVGRGATHRAGGRHAETAALASAGERARGATLYVTLEPCAHQGRTPPCADAIVRAGVARVVAAVRDPNPRVAGAGLARLRAGGVVVEEGVMAVEAARLNAPFFKWITTGLPFVTCKWAMSLDGRIAASTGDSRWISSEAGRRQVHVLRRRSDAVMVGIGTALVDDPRLTPRPPGPRRGFPWRVVVDSQARLPPAARLFEDAAHWPVLVAVGASAPADRVASLQAAGAEVMALPGADGRVDLRALLRALGEREITSVLCEGGSALFGGLRDAGLIDRVLAFVAPILIGGARAPAPIGGAGIDRVADALPLLASRVRRVGADWMWEADLRAGG